MNDFRYNIETNPSNGLISFEVTCEVRQGGYGSSYSEQQKYSMRVNVQKPYDDGNLTGSTIGIIVGVILAIGILVFAKARNMWCFADDENRYNDPANPKSHPGRAGQARGPNQQAQVYRFIHFSPKHVS